MLHSRGQDRHLLCCISYLRLRLGLPSQMLGRTLILAFLPVLLPLHCTIEEDFVYTHLYYLPAFTLLDKMLCGKLNMARWVKKLKTVKKYLILNFLTIPPLWQEGILHPVSLRPKVIKAFQNLSISLTKISQGSKTGVCETKRKEAVINSTRMRTITTAKSKQQKSNPQVHFNEAVDYAIRWVERWNHKFLFSVKWKRTCAKF